MGVLPPMKPACFRDTVFVQLILLKPLCFNFVVKTMTSRFL